jgi:hypothetical protein
MEVDVDVNVDLGMYHTWTRPCTYICYRMCTIHVSVKVPVFQHEHGLLVVFFSELPVYQTTGHRTEFFLKLSDKGTESDGNVSRKKY